MEAFGDVWGAFNVFLLCFGQVLFYPGPSVGYDITVGSTSDPDAEPDSARRLGSTLDLRGKKRPPWRLGV